MKTSVAFLVLLGLFQVSLCALLPIGSSDTDTSADASDAEAKTFYHNYQQTNNLKECKNINKCKKGPSQCGSTECMYTPTVGYQPSTGLYRKIIPFGYHQGIKAEACNNPGTTCKCGGGGCKCTDKSKVCQNTYNQHYHMRVWRQYLVEGHPYDQYQSKQHGVVRSGSSNGGDDASTGTEIEATPNHLGFGYNFGGQQPNMEDYFKFQGNNAFNQFHSQLPYHVLTNPSHNKKNHGRRPPYGFQFQPYGYQQFQQYGYQQFPPTGGKYGVQTYPHHYPATGGKYQHQYYYPAITVWLLVEIPDGCTCKKRNE